jgi:hypothetical protein
MSSVFRQGEETYCDTTTKSVYFERWEDAFRKGFMAVCFLLWV